MSLRSLTQFTGQEEVLRRLIEIKNHNKKKMADWLMEKQGIEVNPDSMFAIQAKRLHEYKRQQLNLLYLIHQYYEIKRGHVPERP